MSLVYGGKKMRISNVGTKRNQAEFKGWFHIHPSSLIGKKTVAVTNNVVLLKHWQIHRCNIRNGVLEAKCIR